MSKVHLVFQSIDYEGDRFMSAWSTRDMAMKELRRIHAKEQRSRGSASVSDIDDDATEFDAGDVSYDVRSIELDEEQTYP